ncbi:DUF1045 domain-containing protein [Minwuia sp.]|uniref:DUF1045 domain-containing protein n=1 Tax=Minwuia sp. TaxID=2493630 RepID=UPI003A925B69
MRYAIYFAPPPEDGLGRLASQWLGRDAYSGARVEMPGIAGLDTSEIASHTSAPRRYGFHGTLKAPFRLAEGAREDDLIEALQRFAASTQSFMLPQMRIARLGRFFALVPAAPSAELDTLACNIVMGFDRFRAPLTEAEVQRRDPDSLNAAQLRNLRRWGYPHVLDCFRFHMTLTGPVGDSDAASVRAALDLWFADVIDRPLPIDSLSLFTEPEKGAPFMVRETFPLVPSHARMTA